MAEDISRAVARRRTFAIIAHPDAGKTTLTEQLLLFGGAIQLAGEVKAKKDRIQTRQGHRTAHAEVVRGVPPARHPDRHLRQQDGS